MFSGEQYPCKSKGKIFRILIKEKLFYINPKFDFKPALYSTFSREYALCEVTVEDGGFVKQRRLPDMLTNLPDRIHLNGR